MAWKSCVIVVVFAVLLPLVISYRSLTKTENRFKEEDLNVNGFKEGDRIPLLVNTIQSLDYGTQCEYIRPFFEWPFCPPGDPLFNRKKTLKEILDGDCYTPTQYELKFKVGTTRNVLCEKNLSKDEVSKFRGAVIHKSKYKMYYNNNKFTQIVGITDSGKVYLVKHINFYPHYYKNQVTDIYSASDFDSAVDITEDAEIKVNFTYSVFWKELNISLKNSVFWKEISTESDWTPAEPEIWGVMIMSLIGWAAIIYFWVGLLLEMAVPYLPSYFTQSSQGNVRDTLGVDISQENPGDSWRRPPNSSLLGAFLGTGIQHLIVICSLLLMAYIDVLYPCKPESVYNKILLVYCLSSVVSGYRATSFHARYSSHGWKQCVFETGALYFLPVFLTVLVLDTLKKVFYNQSNLPEFGTAVTLFIIWGLSTVIFLTLGGRIGYSSKFESQEHSATSRTQSREIPQQSWWMGTPAQMFLGGLLPFMTIFWDMDEIYASLYNLKVCGALSSLIKAFVLLIITTIFVGIGCTYHQKTKQDHQWWWRSVLRGGSTAIFMFAYGIYFYPRAGTEEFTKLFLLMGYNACIFYSLFLVLGTIGFFASSIIAHRKYLGGRGQDKHE